VIDAISDYLATNNANSGGAYHTSRNNRPHDAKRALPWAIFWIADADEVVIGPNMTTLTYAMSRSIGVN